MAAAVKVWTCLAALAAAGCQSLPPGAECRALDGRPLFSPAIEGERRVRLEAQLAEAQAAAAAAPQDRDAAIWVGRRVAYLGRFRDAVAVFTQALEQHPGDAFLLRHRGHRWITLREFARARHDLEAARGLLATVPDRVEPDGQPTPGRPPHSSLHYNVLYHLGLACFLEGDWTAAAAAWEACLASAANDESRVAVTHWLWCTRMRLGDAAGATAVVASIRADMDVVENRGYHQLCLLYAGKLQRAEILAPAGSAGAALAFGLAHSSLVTGDRDGARRQFEALAADPGWAAFGVIAAEVELLRSR